MKYKLTIDDATKLLGIERAAIYSAIRKGNLKAEKVSGAWMLSRKGVDEYRNNRYCRTKSKDEAGNLIYDKTLGFFSPIEAAEYLGIPRCRMYYLLHSRVIPFTRHGKWSYVLKLADLDRYDQERRKQWDKNKS